MRVVEALDVVGNCGLGLCFGGPDVSMDEFLFELVVDALHDGVVVAVSAARHALPHLRPFEASPEDSGGVLGEFNRLSQHLEEKESR